MKLNFKIIIALLTTLLFSSQSYAANKWKIGTKIYGVQALVSGAFIDYGQNGDGPACTEGGKLFYVAVGQNGVTEEGLKTLLSVALSAFAAEKQVSFQYNDSTSSCYISTIYMR